MGQRLWNLFQWLFAASKNIYNNVSLLCFVIDVLDVSYFIMDFFKDKKWLGELLCPGSFVGWKGKKIIWAFYFIEGTKGLTGLTKPLLLSIF